ncbi:class I SAM-dependent methyltransferase [Patescibacteria group bacterium]|nr:class I SAM-dependent methyltransferase [Patescibacteria group bacterium]
MNIQARRRYNEAIKHYYDSSQLLYRLFCYNSKTLGMHHGFWDRSTKTIAQAIINENQAMIDLAGIKTGDKVLDAGCGVGGTSIYIAKKTGARVYGISLSSNQVRLAKSYSRKHGVSQLTQFQVEDFTKTKFPANFFDIVYGIESICHAFPKRAFLNEARRVLKPGGKIVIADGYCRRQPANRKENEIIEDFTRSFALHELLTYQQMSQSLRRAGFIKIRAFDKTNSVKPSVEHFFRLAWWARPISWLLPALERNRRAIICEKDSIKLNLTAYFIHSAEKPA